MTYLASTPTNTPFGGQHRSDEAKHLNTPRLVADSAGTTVWRWDQAEPFGNNPADEDPDANSVAFDLPLRLPGQRYDKETGLHYNMARDYDAAIARYAESDPIGLAGGINTYAYVRSSPLSFTDPEGLNPVYGGLAAARAAARAAVQAIKKAYDLCKRIRCTIHNDPAHHYFGWPLNRKMCHVQVDCYLKGVRKSTFLRLRFPYPCDSGKPGSGGGAVGGVGGAVGVAEDDESGGEE